MIRVRASFFAAVALPALWAAAAVAQEGSPPGPPPDGGPEGNSARREAIEQFDEDGDGELAGPELRRAGAFLDALRRELGDRRRDRDPGRGDAEGPRPPRPWRRESGRRPDRDAESGGPPPRPEDPPRPPRGEPMRLFRAFDNDENGELNPDEFRDLMGALRELRGLMGPLDGPRFGSGGPPPEGRRFGRGPGRRGRPPEARGEGDGGAAPPFEGPPPGEPPAVDGDDAPPPPRRERGGDRGRRSQRPEQDDTSLENAA